MIRRLSRSTPSAVSANTIVSSLLSVETGGRGFIDITGEVEKFLHEAGAREGTASLFIRHTSASLTIQENADPSVLQDLTTALSRLAQENAGWVHDTEGPDDMAPRPVAWRQNRPPKKAGASCAIAAKDSSPIAASCALPSAR